MKRLLIVILVASGLWFGYWFVGAYTARHGFANWFETRRAEGWVADYADFALRGFPNRFDATWTDLTLADPETGLAWDLPLFQILALAYRPNHVIAVWPHEMRIATPEEKFTLTTDALRASLRLSGSALELERAVMEGTALRLSGAETAAMEDLHLAAERTGDPTYRYGIRAAGITPPAARLSELVGTEALPETMQLLSLDAHVTFDKAWDRTAIDIARPQPRRIDLTAFEAAWGVMRIRLAGNLDLNEAGLASGDIALRAEHWRDMLQIAEDSGAIPEAAARAITAFLGMGAQSSGNPEALDVTITLRNGTAFLGFIPLGPVPPIRLR